MPQVSVIIPNYNHEAFLVQRIESVLNQTFTDFELILLDDCSLDSSRKILQKYASANENIVYHPNEKNSGSPFHQWNKGVSMAKGEYIWIAESDDYCEPDFLETLVNILNQNEQCGIAYCQSNLVNENGKILNSYSENLKFIYKTDDWENDFIKKGEQANKDWLLFHNPIPNASGVLMRKSAFINSGSADPAMKLNGDWFLYAKILCQWDLAFSTKHLNYFRVHDQTQRKRTFANHAIFTEIIKLNTFIRENVTGAEGNANKAMVKVSGWWAGSIPSQKWNREMIKGNRKLYKTFSKYKPRLFFGILVIHIITYLRNILIALGILKPLKKLRQQLFPGKYFEH